MNFFDKIFNRDIYPDIKKNILKYQEKLCIQASTTLKNKEFENWMKTKKWLQPDIFLRMEFSNLYFNYRLNELLENSESIKTKEFLFIKDVWILDYVDKFWFLQNKFESGTKLTQEEFDTFFLLGGVFK